MTESRWFYVQDGDPERSVELTGWSGVAVHEADQGVPDLYEPYLPGDSVQLFPVRTENDVQGYIAVRTAAYAEPMTETSPEPVGDEPDVRTWVLDDGTDSPFGPVERALREDLTRLKTTAHLGTTLIASATALAQAMDRAQPDKIASIGREFREHLKRIEELSGDDNASVQHSSNLSTPV